MFIAMAGNFGFEPYTGSDRFVFISYKSEEERIAADYARHLRDNGVNVYYDAALAPSQNWAKTLLDTIGLDNCAGVVLIASERSVRSQPVIDEVRKAHYSQGKTVLAVYIENIANVEEPMKTYLSSTHSVLAWKMDGTLAKQEVLTGTRKMIEGDKTPPKQSGDCDALWNNAQLFLMNSQRSRNPEDVERARKPLMQMTEEHPTDYRGWLGLALCELAIPARSLKEAAARLGAGAGHYSYVVSCGSDSAASPMYTQYKSQFWYGVIKLIESGLENCANTDEAKELVKKCEALDKFFGHTTPDIRTNYENAVCRINDYIDDTADECEWLATSDKIIQLRRFTGTLKDYEIPSTVDGRTVTSIAVGAFEGCTGLASVTIPSTVRYIAKGAFANCGDLTIYGTGGIFSYVRRYARKNKLRYKRKK